MRGRGWIHWISVSALRPRWPELPVLVAALLLATVAWAFVFVADRVVSGRTHQFDNWLLETLRDPRNAAMPRGPRWMFEAARDLTAIGSPAVLALVTAIATGYLALLRNFRAVVFLLAAVLTGALLAWALKTTFDRPRPPLVLAVPMPASPSFPSGHSLGSAVVYLTLGAMLARFEGRRWLKIYWIVVAVLLASIVGMTRIYLGVHYPSDVLAGWAAGSAWALAWWLLAYVVWKRGAEREPIA